MFKPTIQKELETLLKSVSLAHVSIPDNNISVKIGGKELFGIYSSFKMRISMTKNDLEDIMSIKVIRLHHFHYH